MTNEPHAEPQTPPPNHCRCGLCGVIYPGGGPHRCEEPHAEPLSEEELDNITQDVSSAEWLRVRITIDRLRQENATLRLEIHAEKGMVEAAMNAFKRVKAEIETERSKNTQLALERLGLQRDCEAMQAGYDHVNDLVNENRQLQAENEALKREIVIRESDHFHICIENEALRQRARSVVAAWRFPMQASLDKSIMEMATALAGESTP